MLELYHFDRSSAARKVRIALAEKGLQWESHVLDTSVDRREQLAPEYLAINPRGVVPTLIHDGRVVCESQVILEYLEDVYPEPALRPADPYWRAQMRLWTKRADEGLHSQSRVLAMCIYMRRLNEKAGSQAVEKYYEQMRDTERRKNDRINIEQGLDSPLLPDAVAYFKATLHEMEEALATRPWLAGQVFSLADISLGVYVTRIRGLGMASLWSHLSRLNDWYRRFESRPSFAQGVTRWGDASSVERERDAAEAFPAIEALWRAA